MQREKKSGGKGRLMGDGLPCLLSGDEFYEKVVEHEAAQKRKERELEARKEQHQEMAEMIAEWKKAETKRKEENKERRERFQEAVKVWEKLREEAAVKAGRPKRFKHSIPKPTLGPLLKAIPKRRRRSEIWMVCSRENMTPLSDPIISNPVLVNDLITCRSK